MAVADPTVTDVVTDIVDTHGGAIVKAGLNGALPQAALDAAQDLRDALRANMAAGQQLGDDLAELTRRKDLLPVDGHARLVADAKRDAIAKTAEAENATERAYSRLETALEDAALPTFEPAREQLARDEAALALSGGAPESAALQFALHGNAEAIAALLSPWGATLLRSRGVENVDRTLAEVRRVAVDRAVSNDDNAAARAIRDHLPKLAAAKGAAGTKTRQLANWQHVGPGH